LAIDSKGRIMNNTDGRPEVILCNFELVWKMSDTALSSYVAADIVDGENLYNG